MTGSLVRSPGCGAGRVPRSCGCRIQRSLRKTVPALSSSPVSAALEQLSRLSASDRALLPGQCPGLAEYLERVPDRRNRRGVRHSLTSLLMAAVAAVLAGATSFTAVGEWAADAPPQALAALGVHCDPLTPAGSCRRMRPPSAACWKRPTPTASRHTCRLPSISAVVLCPAGPGGRQDQRDYPVPAAARAAGPGRVRHHRRRAAHPARARPVPCHGKSGPNTSWP